MVTILGRYALPVNPFQEDGLWLRCALHAHTTNSDGELAPELLVRHYEWAGYDVLAITDHWARTAEPSTKKLLVIPSTELNAIAPTQEHDAHVLALGLDVDPVLPEGSFAPLEEVVAWIADNGGVPYLAHTYWSGLRTEQWWDCPGLLGIEVWNSGCELELGRGDSSLHWDEALEHGRPFFGLATDDSHHPGYDSGLASTWVRAKEKTREAVLEALRDGLFYGSTGPEIRDIEVSDGDVVVRCSPAEAVTLYSGRWRGARANAGRLGYPNHSEILERNNDGLITAARLFRPYDAPYGRVEVLDKNGDKAWSNPLWIG
ncbi:MAG: hypothetical protein JWO17_279 [Actinomycetia bacterium]|nr:hypothetical protein [Actinomycetes bacterium]